MGSKMKKSKQDLAVGDLVEHSMYYGYRGIVKRIVKTRGSTRKPRPRVVEVLWFPPLTAARALYVPHKAIAPEMSVLSLKKLSSAKH